jgi:hypothetical protein
MRGANASRQHNKINIITCTTCYCKGLKCSNIYFIILIYKAIYIFESMAHNESSEAQKRQQLNLVATFSIQEIITQSLK